MSSLLFVAPSAGLLVALAVLFLWRLLTSRDSGNRWANTFVSPTLFAIFSVVSLSTFAWLPGLVTRSGLGVLPAVANRHLSSFQVPTEASDVNFRHAIFNAEIDVADFEISKTDFLAWAARNHWKLETIGGSAGPDRNALLHPARVAPVAPRLDGRYEVHEVREGYVMDESMSPGNNQSDSRLAVLYDRQEGRAYVSRTTF